jgi:3-oxoadipate enol-lactonase
MLLHHLVDGPSACDPATAPTIVMLPSHGGSTMVWQPQLPRLMRHARVVRLDVRGQGRSDASPQPPTLDDHADDVAELLDHLQVTTAHLVGVSLGGTIALHTAARHSELVERVVVLCSSAAYGNRDLWLERAQLARTGGLRELAEAAAHRYLTPELAAVQPWRIAALARMVRATPAEGYAQGCELLAELDIRSELGSVQAPVLAVAADGDVATPQEHLSLISSSVPNGRYELVTGAAHLAQLERPDEISALIEAHLGLTSIGDA